MFASIGTTRVIRQSAGLVMIRRCRHGRILSSQFRCFHRPVHLDRSCGQTQPSSSSSRHPINTGTSHVVWIRTHNYSSSQCEKKEDKTDGKRGGTSGFGSTATSWAEQLRSVPNIITLSRIASTPILSYLIVNECYEYAVGGCILFGLSDWLDGHIARNYEGQSTVLGTYLDPLADKFMVNTLAVSLWYTALLPGPVVGIWLARDVGLVVTSFAFVANRTKGGESVINPSTTPLKVQPSTISKVNTVLQFLTISSGMAQPLLGLEPSIVLGLCWITGGTTILSGLGYVGGKSMIESGNESQKQNR